jgi:hypothetical protein
MGNSEKGKDFLSFFIFYKKINIKKILLGLSAKCFFAVYVGFMLVFVGFLRFFC